VTLDTARTIVRTTPTLIGALGVRRGEADALICGQQGRFLKHARDIQSTTVRAMGPGTSKLAASGKASVAPYWP
jgi:malate dehydrogenase (oxaloacetate-decarboxylating)(NADP+)